MPAERYAPATRALVRLEENVDGVFALFYESKAVGFCTFYQLLKCAHAPGCVELRRDGAVDRVRDDLAIIGFELLAWPGDHVRRDLSLFLPNCAYGVDEGLGFALEVSMYEVGHGGSLNHSGALLQGLRKKLDTWLASIERATGATSVAYVQLEGDEFALRVEWAEHSYQREFTRASVFKGTFHRPQVEWRVEKRACDYAREIIREVLSQRGVL